MFMAAREQSRASKTPAEAGRSEFARIDLSPLTGSAAIVSRHKRLIAVSGVLGLAAAALFILIAPERFTAATQLLIEPRELRVFDKSVTEPSAINDTATAKVETQVRVLTSDSVLRRVIEHDALMADSEFNGRRRLLGFGSLYPLDTASASSDSSSVGSATVAGERQQDLAAATLDNFRRRVTVKPVPRTFVVEVAVTTQDRRKSMRLADGIVQAYLEDQAVARASAARRAANALTGRLAELREALETAERRVEQFRSQNSIVAANGQFVNESQTADMNAQLSSAQAKTAEKKARYDQIRQLQRTGLELGATTEAVQSQTVAQLRSQYAAVARRESELTASLGPRHPRVIEARAELERARQLVSSEIGRLALTARHEYEQAKANEEALRQAVEKMKREVLQTREAFVRLRELERDAESKRAIYEASATRARELSEQEWVDTTNVRVISAAEYPRNRSWPPSNMLLMALGLFFGVSAGTGYAFLREMAGGGRGRAAG